MLSDNITVMKRPCAGFEPTQLYLVRKELEIAVLRVREVAIRVLDTRQHFFVLAFQTRIFSEIVLRDLQQPGCFGSINQQTAAKICDILNGLNPPDIQFDKRWIASQLEGGACTAVTLEFLVRYFILKTYYLGVDNSDEEIVNDIRCMPKRFSEEDIRSLQGALNTISVCRSTEDCSKLKAQALLSYFNFRIVEASKERDLFDDRPLVEVIQEIRSLVDGIYFVRNILPINNNKMESMGHSTAFIKQGRVHLYYDPNQGVVKINPEQSSFFILKCLYADYKLFKLSRFRFYRIQNEG